MSLIFEPTKVLKKYVGGICYINLL